MGLLDINLEQDSKPFGLVDVRFPNVPTLFQYSFYDIFDKSCISNNDLYRRGIPIPLCEAPRVYERAVSVIFKDVCMLDYETDFSDLYKDRMKYLGDKVMGIVCNGYDRYKSRGLAVFYFRLNMDGPLNIPVEAIFSDEYIRFKD